MIKQKNKDKVLKAFYYDKNDLTFQKMFEENPKEEDFYLICEKINLEHI